LESSLFWDVKQCRLLVTDFSEQYISPTFKGQAGQEVLVNLSLHCVTSHKKDDLIYNMAEA